MVQEEEIKIDGKETVVVVVPVWKWLLEKQTPPRDYIFNKTPLNNQ